MNTEWVNTFLEIVKYGSINLAAGEMFLSQSTISTRLNLLEEELGYKLIQRSKGQRSIRLTDEGRAFLPIAKRLSQIQKEAFDIRYHPHIDLHIAAIDSYNRSFLSHLYKKILSQNPKAQLTINSRHSEEIFNLMERKDIDFGFPAMELNRKNLQIRPLFRQRLYVAKKSTSASGIKTIRPSDLDPQYEVCLHQEDEFQQWHDYWWQSGMQIRVDSFSVLSTLLSMDGYWAILPYSTIQALPPSTPVQIYELSEAPPDRICYLLEHRDQPLSQTHQSVFQILETMLHDRSFMDSNEFIRLT